MSKTLSLMPRRPPFAVFPRPDAGGTSPPAPERLLYVGDEGLRRGGSWPVYPNVTVPEGTPNWITLDLIEDTLWTWQDYTFDLLTPDDSVEILLNVGNLFDALERVPA